MGGSFRKANRLVWQVAQVASWRRENHLAISGIIEMRPVPILDSATLSHDQFET